MGHAATAPLALETWTRRRRRTGQLLDRCPFARDMLTLYEALLEVQERAFLSALDERPAPRDTAAWVAARVLPNIVDRTEAAGPAPLAAASRERLQAGDLVGLVDQWLVGDPQSAVDRYLARAASQPVLEALGSAATAACRGPRQERGCPRCGGHPQVSSFTNSGEELVTGPRRLECSRCGESWVYERMTCVSCGETATPRLPIFAAAEQLAHLRADACESCRRYVISVDLRKDSEAVPLVDELAALPLDLYVQERGFTKIEPNLMGIG